MDTTNTNTMENNSIETEVLNVVKNIKRKYVRKAVVSQSQVTTEPTTDEPQTITTEISNPTISEDAVCDPTTSDALYAESTKEQLEDFVAKSFDSIEEAVESVFKTSKPSLWARFNNWLNK